MRGIAVTLVLAANAGFAAGDRAVPVEKVVTNRNFVEQRELTLAPDEIETMRLQVIAAHPVLASSPGLKAVHANTAHIMQRNENTATIRMGERAYLYFWPYAESHGVKLAMLATCERMSAAYEWNCSKVEQRNYVQLPGQDFEVRVRGQLTYRSLLALKDATDFALRHHPEGPKSAMLSATTAENRTVWVTWGSPEGYTKIALESQLNEGADPTAADNWVVTVHPNQE